MKYFSVFFFLFIGLTSMGQPVFKYLGDDYTGEMYLGTSATYSFLSNNEAPNPELHKLKGFSAKVDLRSTPWELGTVKYFMQYKLLGDLALIVDNQINDDGSAYYRQVSSSITNGLLGWHSFGWTFISNPRMSIALGANINDYFFGATYKVDSLPQSGNLASPEPQGYYFAAGPSVLADIKLNNYLLLHLHGAYSFSYWRAVSLSYASEDDSYPKPHFYQITTELMSPWGVFLGMDYNTLVNRGDLPNNTRRLDFQLGFRWVL